MAEAKLVNDTHEEVRKLYNKRSNFTEEMIQEKLWAIEKRAADTWKSMIDTAIQNECNELYNIARIKILPYCRVVGEEFIKELGVDPYYQKAISYILHDNTIEPEKEHTYHLAIKNLAIGDYFRAYSYLLKAQRHGLSDSTVENAYLFGLCVFAAKNYTTSIHYFLISKESSDKDIKFYSTLFLAVSYRRTEKYEESLLMFDELSKQSNYYFTSNDIKLQRAYTLEKSNPGDELAFNQLTYLAQVGSLEVMKQLIHSKLALGQVDVISSIHLIDPNNYYDHDLAVYFAYILLGKGNYPYVATLMRINVERSRFDATLWYLLGYSLVKSANYSQAAIAMQNASVLAPGNGLYRLALGSCLELEGRNEEAVSLYGAYGGPLEAEFRRRLVRIGCQEGALLDILGEIVLPPIGDLVGAPAEIQIDSFFSAPAVLAGIADREPEDPAKAAISFFRNEA